MSLAEEMLASISVDDGIQTYSAEEEHIVVNDMRQIIVPNSLKTIAVTGDKDVETVTFDCVRFWDGNDLSTFAIYLNYVLPDKTVATYIPSAITTTDGDEFYHFDWQIKNNITKKSGRISFAVTAVKTKQNESGETVVDKQWSSLPNSDCYIALGLDISNVPDDEESADILAQMSAILEQIHSNVDKWIDTGVVQSTGTSTTKVMSQYAVTVALDGYKLDSINQSKQYADKKASENSTNISRNSKRITNLEKGIIPEPFETDSTVAYVKDVPESALTYAEINKIGGITRRCRNAIPFPYSSNTSMTVAGVTFTSREDGGVHIVGTANGNADYTLSQSISLKATTYTMTYIPNVILGADAFIGGTWKKSIGYANGSNYTFSLTKEDIDTYRISVFIRVPNGKTLDTVVYPMIAEGSDALRYEPYYKGFRNVLISSVSSKDSEGNVINAFQIPDEVKGLSGYGEGVSEKYYNHVSWEEDDGSVSAKWNAYTFREMTLTGSEGWSVTGTEAANNLRFGLSTSLSNAVTKACVSTHYDIIRVNIQDSYAFGSAFAIYSGGWIEFIDRRFTTVSEWKAFLAQQYANGNPVKVLVAISDSPSVEEISDIITTDNFIKVSAAGTISFENEYMYDAPSTVTYQVRGE